MSLDVVVVLDILEPKILEGSTNKQLDSLCRSRDGSALSSDRVLGSSLYSSPRYPGLLDT